MFNFYKFKYFFKSHQYPISFMILSTFSIVSIMKCYCWPSSDRNLPFFEGIGAVASHAKRFLSLSKCTSLIHQIYKIIAIIVFFQSSDFRSTSSSVINSHFRLFAPSRFQISLQIFEIFFFVAKLTLHSFSSILSSGFGPPLYVS